MDLHGHGISLARTWLPWHVLDITCNLRQFQGNPCHLNMCSARVHSSLNPELLLFPSQKLPYVYRACNQHEASSLPELPALWLRLHGGWGAEGLANRSQRGPSMCPVSKSASVIPLWCHHSPASPKTWLCPSSKWKRWKEVNGKGVFQANTGHCSKCQFGFFAPVSVFGIPQLLSHVRWGPNLGF